MDIKVTVTIGSRVLPVDQVTDARIANGLRGAAAEVARKLGSVRCPEHGKTATQVRLHFDARGAADLKYESCCEKLGKKIGEALG
jgi:hypothetical protein